MKITFLVGNGFDRSAGLDTSYEGFYRWYVRQPSLNEPVKQFKNEINSYVLDQKMDPEIRARWADFESGVGQYTDRFTAETSSDFLMAYEDAHEALCSYLENEVSRFNTDRFDPETITGLRDGLKNFYSELKPVERDLIRDLFERDSNYDTIIKFISFNYTPSLDHLVKILSEEPLDTWSGQGNRTMSVDPDVLHIHGTTALSPIVGVYDESQIANPSLLSVPGIRQALIKSTSVQTAGERWYEEAGTIIDTSRIICILGMSIGSTDAFWWNRIIQWLRHDGQRQLIVFRHSSSFTKRSILGPYQIRQETLSRLTAFSNLSQPEIDAISSRVHVITNSETVLRITFSLADAVKL